MPSRFSGSGCADAAASLAKHKRGGLELGLRTVSTEVAEALSRHEGEWLCLPELTMLSDAQAEAFGKHGGRQLILGSLATLSPEQANALAMVEEEMELLGLVGRAAGRQ